MNMLVLSHQYQIYVVNGAIYLIASWDCFLNTPSCYVINQQQLQ